MTDTSYNAHVGIVSSKVVALHFNIEVMQNQTVLVHCYCGRGGSTDPILNSSSILHLFSLTHTAPLRYELELEGEVVRFLNADRSSPLLFECEVSGQPVATVSFLKNGKPITPDDNRVTVEMLAPSCRYTSY